MVVYLTTSRVRAQWLGRWEPYAALSIVAAIFLPVVVWDAAAKSARASWRSWVRAWLWASGLGIVVVALALAAHVRTGWLRPLAPELFTRGDPTRDLLSWSPVVEQLRSWGFPRPGVLVATARWDDAAKLALALGPATEVMCVGQDPRGSAFCVGSRLRAPLPVLQGR